nr:endopeptidase, NLPC/P60 domain, LRAT-like domain protein [Tanacetum cinerariifolium]
TLGQSAAFTNLIIDFDMMLPDDSPSSETEELFLWGSLVTLFDVSILVATQQWNSFALTVGKCTSRGITITSSGNSSEHFIALTVGKCTSRGNTITSSGNSSEHFIALTAVTTKGHVMVRVLNEFNRLNFQKRTKDMLSRKWSTLNHHCQKFNAIYKRCNRLKKSGENEVDLTKQARGIFRDENKNNAFNHEDAWEILREHAKWDAPDPASVDLTEDEHVPPVNTQELFGLDARPCPLSKEPLGKKTKSDTSASTGGVALCPNLESLCYTSFVSNGKPPKRRLRWRKRKTGR